MPGGGGPRSSVRRVRRTGPGRRAGPGPCWPCRIVGHQCGQNAVTDRHPDRGRSSHDGRVGPQALIGQPQLCVDGVGELTRSGPQLVVVEGRAQLGQVEGRVGVEAGRARHEPGRPDRGAVVGERRRSHQLLVPGRASGPVVVPPRPTGRSPVVPPRGVVVARLPGVDHEQQAVASAPGPPQPVQPPARSGKRRVGHGQAPLPERADGVAEHRRLGEGRRRGRRAEEGVRGLPAVAHVRNEAVGELAGKRGVQLPHRSGVAQLRPHHRVEARVPQPEVRVGRRVGHAVPRRLVPVGLEELAHLLTHLGADLGSALWGGLPGPDVSHNGPAPCLVGAARYPA
jgi:hypothetical protein